MTAHELLVRAAMCRWAACSSKSESLASFVSEQAHALVAGTLVDPDELLRLALFAEILPCEGEA